MDREVKLSFWQILLSPFISIKNMVTSENDIEPDTVLSVDSTDATEKELANSSRNIDNKVDAYGKSGKAKRRETLKAVKVDPKDLAPQPVEKVEREQDQREDEYTK